MSTLSDYVDRLASLATSICTTASAAGRSTDSRQDPSSSAGPFTRAVLHTHLGDLIRDIDPSELGLFTLVQPPAHAAPQNPPEDAPMQKAEIGRVALPVATPLRKPPPASHFRREDGQRAGEYEPEVYANAAVKFLDRYQSIRHLPRYQEQAEHIIEQLAVVRHGLVSLNEQLKQAGSNQPSEPQISPKSIAKNEEARIQAAQAKIIELGKRKEALLRKQQRAQPNTRAIPKPKPAPNSPPPPDEQEATFWNTPGAAARTLHFTDELLTDEQMDISDISALASPLPGEAPVRAAASRRLPRAGPSRGRALQFTHTTRHREEDGDVNSVLEPPGTEDISKGGDDDNESEGDKTVMFDDHYDHQSPAEGRLQSHEPARPATRTSASQPKIAPPPEEAEGAGVSQAHDTDPGRKARVRVTTDMERIVSKIWATVGDIVMPGHSFDLTGSRSGSKPPRAKETIAHLESLALQTQSLGSPSASSISFSSLSLATTVQSQSSGPTTQQILTARMLLALLNSPPSYAMPLNKLKEVLSTAGGQGSLVTRPIYGCVAKRLLRIERGGREQVVKFDVETT